MISDYSRADVLEDSRTGLMLVTRADATDNPVPLANALVNLQLVLMPRKSWGLELVAGENSGTGNVARTIMKTGGYCWG